MNDINTNIIFIPIHVHWSNNNTHGTITFLKFIYGCVFIVCRVIVIWFFLYHLAAAMFAIKNGCDHTHKYHNDLPISKGLSHMQLQKLLILTLYRHSGVP